MSDSNYSYCPEIISNIGNALSLFVETLEKAHEWYERNADTIVAYINAFADFGVWCVAVDKMKERQIVFTDNLSMEFANEIYISEDVDTKVQNYYLGNNGQQMDALILRCEQSQQVVAHGSLFPEIITAYKMNHYQLACAGLFSLIDGILTDISDLDKRVISFKKRIDDITEKFCTKVKLSDIDRQLWCIYASIHSFDDTIFYNSDFSKPEPDSLNRHWVVHGRTHKIYTQYDCLKALLWIDAITILANIGKRIEGKEMG